MWTQKISLLLIALISATSAWPADSKTIVITAFEPFDHQKQNSSEPVARETAKRLEARGFTTRVCVLPTEYDRASKAALECLDGLPNAKLMVSIGQGLCDIQIETQARNRDKSDVKDNAGEKRRRAREIIPGAPEYVPLTIDANFLYWQTRAGLKDNQLTVHTRVSTDAGSYVCNNTAYRVQTKLNMRTEKPKYVFVHVPKHSCMSPLNDMGKIADGLANGLEMVSRQP